MENILAAIAAILTVLTLFVLVVAGIRKYFATQKDASGSKPKVEEDSWLTVVLHSPRFHVILVYSILMAIIYLLYPEARSWTKAHWEYSIIAHAIVGTFIGVLFATKRQNWFIVPGMVIAVVLLLHGVYTTTETEMFETVAEKSNTCMGMSGSTLDACKELQGKIIAMETVTSGKKEEVAKIAEAYNLCKDKEGEALAVCKELQGKIIAMAKQHSSKSATSSRTPSRPATPTKFCSYQTRGSAPVQNGPPCNARIVSFTYDELFVRFVYETKGSIGTGVVTAEWSKLDNPEVGEWRFMLGNKMLDRGIFTLYKNGDGYSGTMISYYDERGNLLPRGEYGEFAITISY